MGTLECVLVKAAAAAPLSSMLWREIEPVPLLVMVTDLGAESVPTRTPSMVSSDGVTFRMGEVPSPVTSNLTVLAFEEMDPWASRVPTAVGANLNGTEAKEPASTHMGKTLPPSALRSTLKSSAISGVPDVPPSRPSFFSKEMS